MWIIRNCIPAKSKSETSQGKKRYLTELRVCKRSVDQLIMQLSELKVEVNVSESDRSLALAAQVWPDVARTSWTNNTSDGSNTTNVIHSPSTRRSTPVPTEVILMFILILNKGLCVWIILIVSGKRWKITFARSQRVIQDKDNFCQEDKKLKDKFCQESAGHSRWR